MSLSMVTGGAFHPFQQQGQQQPGGVQGMPQAQPPHLYTAAGKDAVTMDILDSFFGIADATGIRTMNWDAIADKSSGSKTGISYIRTMLQMALQNCGTPTMPIDQEYKELIQRALNTVNKLAELRGDANSISNELPAETSPEITSLRSSWKQIYLKFTELRSQASLLPGTAHGIAMGGIDYNASGDGNDTDAALAASQMRLQSTQAMLEASHKSYENSVEVLGKNQAELAKTRSMLTRLTTNKLNLEAIKTIILESIRYIVKLREQIMNLCNFFQSLANMIKIAVNNGVHKFLKEITSIVTDGATMDMQVMKIGNFTLLDLHRTELFTNVVYIRAYFSVFADIAKMWKQMSVDNIRPGITLCNQMSEMSGVSDNNNQVRQLQEKQRQLDKWSDTAEKNVREIAHQTQQKIIGQMGRRVTQIMETTKQLPPSASVAAIEKGAEQARQAMDKMITEKTEAEPVKEVVKGRYTGNLDDEDA